MYEVNASFAETASASDLFRFSGQSTLEAWTLREFFEEHGWSAYDRWLSHEPVLCFQRIRELVDAFPTWQHRAATGRDPIDDRTILVALLVKQFLGCTYRQLESFLRLLADFFRVKRAPDATTVSGKNRTARFAQVLRRFHGFVLETLPRREIIAATDATGFSNTKQVWSETDYGLRATGDWVKAHCVVEVPTLLYLNPALTTKGKVHESRMFESAWEQLPSNVKPVRSLADAAYASNACLETALAHGATPLHGLKKNARHVAEPTTAYERLVNFATHWPNRFAGLTGLRALVETAFSATKAKFGDRLRCRHPIARRNEVQAKQTAHNIRMIVSRQVMRGG